MKKSLMAALAAGMMVFGVDSAISGETGGDYDKMNPNETVSKEDVKKAVGKLRGRLLYKKNQARKMERAVEASSQDTKDKIAGLRKQIADLYIASNPKLADNYAEQRDLEGRIAALKK